MYLPFIALYRYLKQHPLICWLSFFCSIFLFAFFASKIHFKEDLASIIPQDEKTRKVTELFENPKFADKVTIMVALNDTTKTEPDSLMAYADRLVQNLTTTGKGYISKIQGAVENETTELLLQTIQTHLPVFLDDADYLKIDSLQHADKIKSTLENNLKQLSNPAAFIVKDIITKDPTGMSFIALNKLQKLRADNQYELYENYIFTKDFKTLLIFVNPVFTSADTKENLHFVNIVQQSIANNNIVFKDINAQVYGGSIVAAGNSIQLKKDSFLTQGITILFLILFIALYFKKALAPLLMLIPVLYGALFSLAVLYFMKGAVSVIAVATGSIVLGIAINYSLHVFNHQKHTNSIAQTIKDLAKPLTIGSLTTIFGFLCLTFAKSEMLQDLGRFAAFSLVGAAICSLVFLPHFLKERKETVSKTHKKTWIDSIADIRFENNKWLIIGILVVSIFFVFQIHKVSFESDMSGLSYMSSSTKKAEDQFNSITGSIAKSIYIVNEGTTEQEALKNAERTNNLINELQKNHQILSTSGVASILISDSVQAARIDKWNAYWSTERKAAYLNSFSKQATSLGFSDVLTSNTEQLLNTRFLKIDTTASNQIKKSLLDEFVLASPSKTSIITIARVDQKYKDRVVKAIETDSNAQVLDRQYLSSQLTQLVNEDFKNISWMVSIVVALVLLITFGRIELMLIAFLPMLLSWIWILGIMALVGIEFNIVNIIVSTLIFGLGDDYSLFVMDGLLNEYKTKSKLLASYKSSIIISAITTIAGLGVMGFAQHPALKSIAFISVVGILSVVMMAQIMIPFLFKLLITNRAQKKFHPWTLWSWHRSSFSFLYFASTSILLTTFGFILVKLKPFGLKRGKYLYHILLSKFCMSVLYIMFNFKKKVVNQYKENFKKPAVVIANHQSFLDILTMAMLHPKLILLTNQWVWKSPVFGWAIKMADFYPVANGIEASVDLLKKQTDAGYSIVVFPEGTRTSVGPMKRFHKGAFYLAEKLQLDVVPVVLHGTGYTMTKGDYLLKNGPLTATYLPRIDATDFSWGGHYQERSKSISKYFKKEYQAIKNDIETPKYFAEKLKFNYLYKGPILEWYLFVKLKLENYYEQYHQLLPKSGAILDAGCGYGFMSYILYWASHEQRKITALDYDEEKIATAQNCFDKTDDINFYQVDITQFRFEKYDGIVMSDVLHYIHPLQQKLVIEKAMDSLHPGGVLLIRDGDADLQKKLKGTKFTEFLSTKLFSFNRADQPLHFLSGTLLQSIATEKSVQIKCINDAKYTSNVLWVMTKINANEI